MTSIDIAAQTQVVCQFVLQSTDPRCDALRNLLLHPPPSDGADNKEQFMAALESACRAMKDNSQPLSSLQTAPKDRVK
jgi:hypothetical protein